MLVLVLSSVVGLSLGLLGGGGSILTVPLLIYGGGIEEKSAIATSLLVVSLTSIIATIPHAMRGSVRWSIGLIFASGAMCGAFLGGRVGAVLPASLLMVLFGLMMLVTGTAMWRGKKEREAKVRNKLPIALMLVEGVGLGFVTGLVGAGGGFLVVPALVLLAGLSMREAVGTSLFVIVLNSASAFAGYYGKIDIDLTLALEFAGVAAVGAVAGGAIGQRLDQAKLRKGFALFVFVMAVFILGRQILDLTPG